VLIWDAFWDYRLHTFVVVHLPALLLEWCGCADGWEWNMVCVHIAHMQPVHIAFVITSIPTLLLCWVCCHCRTLQLVCDILGLRQAGYIAWKQVVFIEVRLCVCIPTLKAEAEAIPLSCQLYEANYLVKKH